MLLERGLNGFSNADSCPSTALGRRPNTPQVFVARDCWIGQSDEGATARPYRPLTEKRGVWAGDRRRAKRAGMPKNNE